MSASLEPSRGIEVDVDTRLAELWAMVWDPAYGVDEKLQADEHLRGQVAGFLRAAYGIGYAHALREDKAGRRSELHRAHGYRPE